MVYLNKIIKRLSLLWIAGTVMAVSSIASAEILFEGYYRIKAGNKAVGYTVQRYEFDAKKKQFKSTYFIKTGPSAGAISESLKAVSNDKFQPISYQYTAQVGDKAKTIDAKFDKGVMTARVSDGTNAQQVSKKIQEGTFLSTFLGYLMLQNGYKVGKKYSYKAIAEEDASIYAGEAFIKEELDHKNYRVYRILNDFKNAKFVSLVSPKGEILATSSPVQKISTELVATAAEATAGLMVPAKTMKLLFGTMPTGKKNLLAQSSDSAKVPKPDKPATPLESESPTPPEKPTPPDEKKGQ